MQPANPAFKQFEEIQRTRSAPPQLSEQEKLQLAQKQQQQLQAQQQKAPPAGQQRPPPLSGDKGRAARPPAAHHHPQPGGLSLNPAASSFAPQQFFPARPMPGYMAPPPHGYYVPYNPAYGMYPPQGFIPPQGFRPPAGVMPPMLPTGAPAVIAVPQVPPKAHAPPPSNNVHPPANMNNGPPNGASITPVKQAPVDAPVKVSPAPQPAVIPVVAHPVPMVPVPVPVPAMPATTPIKPVPVPSNNISPPSKPPVTNGAMPPTPTKPIVLPKRERKVLVFTNPETGEAVKLPDKEKETKKEEDESEKKPSAEEPKAVEPAPAVVTPVKSEQKESKKNSPAVAPSKAPEPKTPSKEQSAPSKPAAVSSESPAKKESQTPSKKPADSPAKAAKAAPPVPTWPAKQSPTASPPPKKPVEASPAAPAQPVKPAQPVQPPVQKQQAAPIPKPTEVTPAQKLTYSRDFLMKFRELCVERPVGMPSVEALVGEESGPGSRRSSRTPAPPARSRHSDIGVSASRQSSRGGGPSRSSGGQKYPPGMPTGGRHSLGPRKPSGPGSRRSQPPVQETKEYVAPLVKTENRWVPGAKEEDPVVALVRNARSLLNKLTLEKFDSISKKMIALEIQNDEMLTELIAIIFEKAVDEPKFAEMYARLCYTLASTLPSYPQEYIDALVANAKDGQTAQNFEMRHQFRRSLLLKCQSEFQAKTEWSKIADDDIKITDNMSEEQLAEIAAEKSRRQKLKRRALGNIKFIGELFKLGVLTEKIMHFCLKDLLANIKDPEEEAIESVCDLMEIVGEKLDHSAARHYMDAYFERLTILEQNEVLPSRVRFKIKDVLELRSRNWRERERQKMLNAGPMTIDEVHQAAAQQEKAEQRKLDRLSRGGRKSGDDRRHSTRAGRDAPRPNSILKRTDSKASSQTTKFANERPASRDTTGRKLRDDASGVATPKTAASRSTSVDSRVERTSSNSRNMFDALTANGAGDREDGEISEDEISDSPVEFVICDLKKQIKEDKEFDDYFAKEFKTDFFTAVEDSYSEAVKTILTLRSFVPEDQTTAKTISALEKLITDISPETKKDTPDSRKRVDGLANVFAQIFSSDLLSKEDFDSFMENQLVNMSDMILDIPGLDAMLGHICASCILSKLMDFNFVKAAILKMAQELGDFTPRMPTRPGMRGPSPPAVAEFFGTLLSSIQETEGTSFLQELWLAFIQEQEEMEFNGTLEQMDAQTVKYPWFGTDREKLALIPDSLIAEWLLKYDLLSSIAPKLQLTYEITKALQPENIDFSEFQKFIESSFDASTRSSAVFVGALTAALLKHIHSLKKSASQKEEDLFKNWLGVVLKATVDSVAENDRPDLQLQILFSAQQIGNMDPLKSNDDQYFRRLFEALYEAEVVDEQTFLKWEEGNEQLETKGLTMARGAKEFLQWLKTAETES